MTTAPEILLPQLFSLNISYWVFQSVAMMATAILLPKLKITSFLGAFLMVVGIAFVNTKAWDTALFFQIPNEFSHRALTLLAVNGVIFWVLVKILPGIEIEGFVTALVAPIIFTFFSIAISEVTPMIDWTKVFQYLIELLQSMREYADKAQPMANFVKTPE